MLPNDAKSNIKKLKKKLNITCGFISMAIQSILINGLLINSTQWLANQ